MKGVLPVFLAGLILCGCALRSEERVKRDDGDAGAKANVQAPLPSASDIDATVSRIPWYWPWGKLSFPPPSTLTPYLWPWARLRTQDDSSQTQPISPFEKPASPAKDHLWSMDDLPNVLEMPEISQRSFEQPEERVKNFAAAHGKGEKALAEFFLPKAGETYIASLPDGYKIQISNTEITTVGKASMTTRSRVKARIGKQQSIERSMNITWKFFDGQWHIEKIAMHDWMPLFGAWNCRGLGTSEPDIELRFLPNHTYVVFADHERVLPSFRGTYTIDGDKLTFTETWRADGKPLIRAVGRYTYTVTKNSLELKKEDDPHRWRGDRFTGMWKVVYND